MFVDQSFRRRKVQAPLPCKVVGWGTGDGFFLNIICGRRE